MIVLYLIKNDISDSKVEKKQEKENDSPKSGEIMVRINEVEPNRDQPRKDFDEDALMELADSIRQFGILQPLLVQKRKIIMKLLPGKEDGVLQNLQESKKFRLL